MRTATRRPSTLRRLCIVLATGACLAQPEVDAADALEEPPFVAIEGSIAYLGRSSYVKNEDPPAGYVCFFICAEIHYNQAQAIALEDSLRLSGRALFGRYLWLGLSAERVEAALAAGLDTTSMACCGERPLVATGRLEGWRLTLALGARKTFYERRSHPLELYGAYLLDMDALSPRNHRFCIGSPCQPYELAVHTRGSKGLLFGAEVALSGPVSLGLEVVIHNTDLNVAYHYRGPTGGDILVDHRDRLLLVERTAAVLLSYRI